MKQKRSQQLNQHQIKGMKAGIAGFLVIMLLGMSVGGSKALTAEQGQTGYLELTRKEEKLTIPDVVRVVKRAGFNMYLGEEPLIEPDVIFSDYEKSAVLALGQDFGQLYIFEFKSIGERKNRVEDLNERYMELGRDSGIYLRGYDAKNSYLLWVTDLSSGEWQESDAEIETMLKTLGKAVFYDINRGTKKVLSGEGEDWQAKYVVMEYQEEWLTDDGYWEYTNYANEKPLVQYKGEPEDVGEFFWSVKYVGSGMGQGGDEYEYEQASFDDDSEQFYRGFSRAFPPGDYEGQFSVTWGGGKQESFALTRKAEE